MAAARFAGPPACLDHVDRPLGARLAVLVPEHPRPAHESRTARVSAEIQIRARAPEVSTAAWLYIGLGRPGPNHLPAVGCPAACGRTPPPQPTCASASPSG